MANTAAKWAGILRDHGIQTLPMDNDTKRPMVRSSEWWGGFPESAMNELSPRNIAALPGVVSRLLVIDLDGPDDLVRQYFKAKPVLPDSWKVSTSSGGMHLWFRLPEWVRRPISKCKLWQGEGKHEEIAVLGDRSLATCPPTRYATGKQYKWLQPKHPLNSKLATAPGWLMDDVMALQERPVELPVVPPQRSGLFFSTGKDYERLFEVHDKLAVLVQHGLKLAGGRPNASGWISCYRPGGDDRSPSASVRHDGSVLWTSHHGGMSFWSALVLLGAYPDEQSAKDYLLKRL